MIVRCTREMCFAELFFVQANVSIVCLLNVTGAIRLSALEWYNGASSYMDASFPSLAVCFENGRAQVMRHELDTGLCLCVCACVLYLCLYFLCHSYIPTIFVETFY